MKPSPNAGLDIDITRLKYKTSKDALTAAGLILKNNQPEKKSNPTTSKNQPIIIKIWDPKTSKESDFPDFVWIDGFLTRDDASNYAPWQRINKIPGMDYICYKSTLFLELNKMKKLFPDIYSKAYPIAFLLPNDFAEFQCEHKRLVGLVTNVSSDSSNSSTPTWVVKPRNGCCGNGISLIQSTYEASDIIEQSVCQLYISPYLINQRKFDFRLYILIASLDPLTFFIYNEGIARFCTDPYEPPSRSNRDKKFCHLTNTAINKGNGSSNPVDFTKKFTEIMTTIMQRSSQKGKNLYAKICDVSRAIILGVLPIMLGSLPRKGDLRSLNFSPTPHGIGIEKLTRSSFSGPRNRSFSPDQKMKRKVIIPRPAPSNIAPINIQNHSQHQSHQRPTAIDLPPLQSVEKNDTKIDNKNDTDKSESNVEIKNETDKKENTNPENTDNSTTTHSPPISDATSTSTTTDSKNEDKAKEKAGKLWMKPSKRYFHIVGIDILLNEELEPYVLELNDRPSLSVTVPFEEDLKVKLMRDTFFHVFPPSNPAPSTSSSPSSSPQTESANSPPPPSPSDPQLIASDNEESGWTQIFPLPENAPANSAIRSNVIGFSNVSFYSKEQWKDVLRKASVPAHPSSSVASTSATNRMASSGINEALHQERRQRFNEIRESTKGIKFNLY